MSEATLVQSLLAHRLLFPWEGSYRIAYKTEVPSVWNRADVVYYECVSKSRVGRIVAVEAKLRDWRKALRQAYRNRLFADEVYVALPETHISPALKYLDAFSRAGVGLLAVGANQTRIIHNPETTGFNSPRHRERVLSYLTR